MKYAAILLAGGQPWRDELGSRLGPPLLVPVANRILIHWLLDWLEEAGIERVAICTNAAGETLRTVVRSRGRPSPGVYYYEDEIPRGPGGTLRDAGELVAADQYLVMETTQLCLLDLKSMLSLHETSAADLTIVASQCTSEGGQPRQRMRPVGIYLVHPRVLKRIPATGFYDMKEALIPRLYEEKALVKLQTLNSVAPRMRSFSSYLALHYWLLQSRPGDRWPGDGYQWSEGVFFHDSARIDSGARFLGPVMVGPGAQVGSGAVVVGPCVVGGQVVIEPQSVVARSVLWNNSRVEGSVRLDRCVVPYHVTVPAGARLANQVCAA